MKKTVRVLLAGLLMLGFTSCAVPQDASTSALGSQADDHTGTMTSDTDVSHTSQNESSTSSGISDTQSSSSQPAPDEQQTVFYITAQGVTFTAHFADNSSAQAFEELLEQGPLTIDMSDYGNFEKVGSLGQSLPTNDEPITTEPGDVILYQSNSITIYYDTNTWNFTHLGKIDDVTKEELLQALGSTDVSVTFSLDLPQ